MEKDFGPELASTGFSQAWTRSGVGRLAPQKADRKRTAKHSVLDWAEGLAEAKLASNDRVAVGA